MELLFGLDPLLLDASVVLELRLALRREVGFEDGICENFGVIVRNVELVEEGEHVLDAMVRVGFVVH